ncbi:MAG TPA: di-heme oxidoredictase family protein, partial [Gemmataceae bacterium]|nr:di-heme oxidoredictase family protein [Gemmataceae bacterium]
MLGRSAPYLLAAVALACVAPRSWAGSSNSLMDISPDGAWLLVTNSDNGTVTVVDVAARRAVREIAVGDKPEGVCWIGGGPLAAVTVYRERLVVFFNAEDGQIVQKLTVADEPYGIVANKAGTKAWVTHEYPGLVSEIDLQQRAVLRASRVGAFLRGLALSPDESRLYVTEFYTAILHAVDLRPDGQLAGVDSWKGHTADNLCRQVVLHPRRPKAYLSHIRSKIERNDGNGSIFPHLSICDLVPPNGTKRRTSFALDTYNGVRVVTNPWESAISPDGSRLYTIYAGTNDMNISEVIDDDYREIERLRVVNVGKNPRAVRVSPDGKTVFLLNALDFAVSFYDAQNFQRLATVSVCAPPKTPEWVRGKILFNTALPPMTSRLWIACASCHPDGHADGRVWQNPEGLRKTTALFGLAHTHPLHWSADRDEVQDFEYTIRSQLMRGRGLLDGPIKPKAGFNKIELEEQLAGRSKDLDALAIYCNSFDFTLSPHIPAPGKLSAAAERGKALFFSKQVGCAECHHGPYYTDSSLQKPFKLHDVGTGTNDPSEKMGPAYDTPTLLGIYRTPPYLHDGRAKSLHEVLTTCNKQDEHGRTSQLKQEELDDLVEFLKSLPYEKPPNETPNTVKYRVVPSNH